MILLATGIILSLAAIVVNVMAIVRGFKQSVRDGVIAVLAPMLLFGGAVALGVTLHRMAMAEVGADEIRQQGDEETQEQIDELKEVENIDLGLE